MMFQYVTFRQGKLVSCFYKKNSSYLALYENFGFITFFLVVINSYIEEKKGVDRSATVIARDIHEGRL